MQKRKAYIALGSNLNNPLQQIQSAIQHLKHIPDTTLLSTSPFYKNPPLGPQDQDDFVNAVAVLETTLDPISLLHALQQIEHTMGRVRVIHWGPRIIDLDLLLFADVVWQDAELTLPHPGIPDRVFFLQPLYDVEPSLHLPNGQAITTLLEHIYLKGAPKMSVISSLQALRREYQNAELDVHTLDPDPIKQCGRWIEEAVKAKIVDPTAMVLATANLDAEPSIRVVLLKGIENGHFVFYTHYDSHKARDIAHNPEVAVNFFWAALERQIVIKGEVSRLSEKESDAYFATRPRASQISTWASDQSKPITARQELIDKFQSVKDEFGENPIPRPENWGGYAIAPYYIEFWQGRPQRLHDRIAYELSAEHWHRKRLSP